MGRNGLQGRVSLEGDADSRESADTVEEVGIEREAEGGQRQELGRSLRIMSGQHTGGRSGRFGKRSAPVKHGDSVAAVVELKGEREADDAGSSNAQVGVVHGVSLVGLGRGYSLGVSVLRGRAVCEKRVRDASKEEKLRRE
jgi:hypothetical protein